MSFLEYKPQSELLQQTEVQLPAPLSLENCANAAIVKEYVKNAHEYKIEVGCKRLRDEVSVDDLNNADRGVILAYVAEALPAIQQAVNQIDVGQVTNSVMPAVHVEVNERCAQISAQVAAQVFAQLSAQLTAQLTAHLAPVGEINARLDGLGNQLNAQYARSEAQNENTQRKFANKMAVRGSDPIQPMLKLPVVDQFVAGQPYPEPVQPEPLPAGFPATYKDLFSLSLNRVNVCLAYYDIHYGEGTLIEAKYLLLAAHLGVSHAYSLDQA